MGMHLSPRSILRSVDPSEIERFLKALETYELEMKSAKIKHTICKSATY